MPGALTMSRLPEAPDGFEVTRVDVVVRVRPKSTPLSGPAPARGWRGARLPNQSSFSFGYTPQSRS